MDSTEYQGIVQYLTDGTYPDGAKTSHRTMWNFRRKCSSFLIGEGSRLFKVG